MEPARARPVPFWRHGFLPPPLTSPRVFVACVPARRLASWLRTISWSSASRVGPASTAAGTSTSPTCARSCDTTGSVTAPSVILPPRLRRLPDQHRPVPPPGDGAAHEEQMLLGADGDDLEVPRRDPLRAPAPGHPLALEDAAREGAVADRAAVPEVLVRAVGPGEARELVPLHHARGPAALRHAGHVHPLARLEHVTDDHLAADRGRLAAVREAELPQDREGRRAGLLELALHRLGEPRRLDRPEAELRRGVALALGAAGRDDGTRTGLDDGDRNEDAGRRVDLRHPELPSDDAVERHDLLELDLDVDAGREVELAERVDRLLGRLEDVEQTLVRADLELLPRLLVDVRGTVHGEAFDVRGQRDGTRDPPAGAADRLHDLPHRLIEQPVIVRLQADADLLVHSARSI